jgi:uncharacterized protein (TIGR00725 family)
MLRRLPIVGVFGQGTPLPAERVVLARDTGALVARLGCHLLTGGGFGVMAAAAEGFTGVADRRGLSIGIIPRLPDGAFDEPNRDAGGRDYPNDFVEIAIRTPLPPRVTDWQAAPSRNHVNVLTADAIVVLPGGAGTSNELDMAALYRGEDALAPEQRKTILFGPPEAFSGVHHAAFMHAASLADVREHLARILSQRGFAPCEAETV